MGKMFGPDPLNKASNIFNTTTVNSFLPFVPTNGKNELTVVVLKMLDALPSFFTTYCNEVIVTKAAMQQNAAS